MPKVVKSENRIKKEAYWARLAHTVETYRNAAFIQVDNVSSKQICMIRAKLRAINAVMVMGKNVSDLECKSNIPFFADPHEGLPLRPPRKNQRCWPQEEN